MFPWLYCRILKINETFLMNLLTAEKYLNLDFLNMSRLPPLVLITF